MSRRVPWLIIPTIVVAAGTAWVLYVVWRSPHRTDLATYWALVVAVASIMASLITWAWRKKLRPEQDALSTDDLNHLADLLARSVKDQWTRAAGERGLLEPEPIPVRWETSSLPLSGPVSAAVSSSRFPPLPGLSAVGLQELRTGHIHDLHRVYGGLGSGRLIIAGAPGSGKTGAAVLLILAILTYREQMHDGDRSRVPIPVMFTLHGWDPQTQPVHDWLALKLQQAYEQFTGRDGVARATELLAAGKIAVILDGLDEIPIELRPIALRALSHQATFRVVVLTRSAEMAITATRGVLEGAAAIELREIDPATAADYLTRVQLHPAPQKWRELTDLLRKAPGSPITQALNSPLTLTLVRDTYRGGEDVGELLNFPGKADRQVSHGEIIDHLLDRVLPAAYTQEPGKAPPRYSLHTAQITLQHIAARMNQENTRDLQWWRIVSWVATTPRLIATGLIFGLVIGTVTVPLAGLVISFQAGAFAGLIAFLVALLIPFSLAQDQNFSPKRLHQMRWRQILGPDSILCGLMIGFSVWTLSQDYGAWFWAALAWRGRGVITARGIISGDAIVAGIIAGLIAAIILAFVRGISYPDIETNNLTPLGWVLSLVRRVSYPDIETANNPLSPFNSWCSDRAYGLVLGLAYGLVCGLTIGLVVVLGMGFTGGLAAGIVWLFASVLIGGLIGILVSSAWAASLAFAHLSIRWHNPLRLMQFLEDARERQVLRTVGPVYQFRHARLQDRLAEAGDSANIQDKTIETQPLTY